MTLKEIRHSNVRRLVEAISLVLGGNGGINVLAEKLNKSQSQVSHFAGEKPKKGIGDIVAPQIEAAFNLPHGALDEREPYIYIASRDESGEWHIERIAPKKSIDEDAADLLRRLTPAEWAYLKQQGEEMIARRMHSRFPLTLPQSAPIPGPIEAAAPGPVTNPTTVAELVEKHEETVNTETLVQNAEPYIEQQKKFSNARAEERKAARAAVKRAEKAKTDRKVEGDGGQPSADPKPKK